MDFTINIYKTLLTSLKNQGYIFQTFSEFLEKPNEKVIMLRHDVDAKKLNSLHFAEIQSSMGIKGTYYFRMVPQSFDEDVISKIAELGHEIGYHYEDMDFAFQGIRNQGSKVKISKSGIGEEQLFDEAIRIFEANLGKLRMLYPIKTICMHGSPRSPFDNKSLWNKYNYRDFGIVGEPYFDINFDEVYYLTDTGRMWDGDRVSVRDRVSKNTGPDSKKKGEAMKISHNHSFHSTKEIIDANDKAELPGKIMFTFHPQRWTNKPIQWVWELAFQNLKNQVKKGLVKKQKI